MASRSEESRSAILQATVELLEETTVQKLSIEAIAKRAGVGKTTIYRWWPNKAAVAMEAFLEQPVMQIVTAAPETIADTIAQQLQSLIRQLRGQNGRIIAGIIAESQSDAA